MSDTFVLGGGSGVGITISAPVNQIIELATGALPTASQLAGWQSYEQAGGSLASIAAAFVSSTAFANAYNNGTPVNPDSAITASITQAIIDHVFGSHTSAQVDAWDATGLSVAQVFQAFALGDQFTSLELANNISVVNIAIGSSSPPVTATGEQTFTVTGASVGSQIVFDNAPTEILASPVWSNEVNVASASSLAQALDMAVANDSALQNGGLIPANTGVIDWFQYSGDTYVVEATNDTSMPVDQTALTSSDTVVDLVGSINLNGEQLSGHTLLL